MADSNNQPEWKEHPEISGTGNKYGEAGNGRGVQQNELPKGARTEAATSNAPTVEGKPLDGNGFGNYDPRYAGKDPMQVGNDHMPEVHGEDWGVSGDGVGDHKNPNFETPTATESNPINNDRDSALRKNPYRNGVKKEWFS